MYRRSGTIRTTAGVLAAIALAGCRLISNSIESASDSVDNALKSIGNGFQSSSNSSGGGTGQSAQNYQRDVETFTVAWLDREEPDGELIRGVGRIAELYGITDWEASPATRSALRDVSDDPRLDSADRARLRAELLPLGPAFATDAGQHP